MGAKFAVPTTINPIGFDLEEPNRLEILGVRLDIKFIKGQTRIIRALRRMGANLTLTCTPYHLPDIQNLKRGDSVAWGESSAILYGNSVLGLKTNREGGPLALMAAISGKTYYWGLHLDELRVPFKAFILDDNRPLDEVEAGIFGKMIAERYTGIRPPYLGITLKDELAVKELLAAVGAAGSLGMVYLPNITDRPRNSFEEKETISLEALEEELSKHAPTSPPEVVFIGCPHARAEDVIRLYKYIKGRASPKSKIVITLSRAEYEKLQKLYPEVLLNLKDKAILIRDTCLIVSPFGRKDKVSIATNSYKAYFYLSKRGLSVYLARIEELASIAYGG
jgi:predicted aconitase